MSNDLDVDQFVTEWRRKRIEIYNGEHGYADFSDTYRAGLKEGMGLVLEELSGQSEDSEKAEGQI